MSDAAPRAIRFPGNLDPTAQEFVPGNPKPTPIPFFTPTSVFFPYASPPPPPSPATVFAPIPLPPPPPPQYPNDIRFLSFYSPPPPPLMETFSPEPLLPPTSTAPTRAVVLISVSTDVNALAVRRDVEVFGEVRGIQMERADEGIVTVHFYDLRHAQAALTEIRERHMQHQFCYSSGVNVGSGGLSFFPVERGLVVGRAVWAHYAVPATDAVSGGNNQGTLVILNLDPTISNASLREIFQVYGDVKELRETPYKKHQRFVEFYDVRDAAKALREMNGREIYGKPVMIQFSRPGGFSRRLFLTSQNYYNKHLLLPPSLRDLSGHHRRFPPIPTRKPWTYQRKENSGASMAALSLHDDPEKVGSGSSNGISKCYVKKSEWRSSSVSQKQQQQKNNNNGMGKHYSRSRHPKKLRDAFFVISEDAVSDSTGGCRDERTTLMIKNIPNKYSQKLLLSMLDNHCIHCNEDTPPVDNMPLSSYDFVYLPIDFNNKCNVGYGFVNMTSPQAAWRLYKAFHHQHWEIFNSRKICEVTYARVQGLEALKQHFKNSKFPCETEQYMPVVFSPPRDGRRLTEPILIVDIVRKSSDNVEDDDNNTVGGEDGACSGSCRADKNGFDDGCYYCFGGDGGGGENGGVLDNDEDGDVDDDGCSNNYDGLE